MRQRTLIIGLLLLLPAAAQAQPTTTPPPPPPSYETGQQPELIRAPASREGRFVGAITYSMSLGVGSTNQFADDFGVRGFSFEMRYFLKDQWSIGLLGGWQLIDDKFRETVQLPNGALTATQIRYIDLIPLLATAQFYFPTGPVVSPYIGLGIGAIHSRREIDLGFIDFVNEGWHFGLAPEVGVTIDTGDVGVLLSVRFHWAVETDSNPGELYFTFNVGLITF